MEGEYAGLQPKDLLTKDIDELKRILTDRKERARRDRLERRSEPVTVPPANVTTLEGHGNEVFICSWSPTASLLASG